MIKLIEPELMVPVLLKSSTKLSPCLVAGYSDDTDP